MSRPSYVFTFKKIIDWMADHNLSRSASYRDAIYPSTNVYSDLRVVLNFRNTALKYLFDKEYGGGSVHLLNDFDDEVLKPLNLHMESISPYEIGLFLGRKLPRKVRSR